MSFGQALIAQLREQTRINDELNTQRHSEMLMSPASSPSTLASASESRSASPMMVRESGTQDNDNASSVLNSPTSSSPTSFSTSSSFNSLSSPTRSPSALRRSPRSSGSLTIHTPRDIHIVEDDPKHLKTDLHPRQSPTGERDVNNLNEDVFVTPTKYTSSQKPRIQRSVLSTHPEPESMNRESQAHDRTQKVLSQTRRSLFSSPHEALKVVSPLTSPLVQYAVSYFSMISPNHAAHKSYLRRQGHHGSSARRHRRQRSLSEDQHRTKSDDDFVYNVGALNETGYLRATHNEVEEKLNNSVSIQEESLFDPSILLSATYTCSDMEKLKLAATIGMELVEENSQLSERLERESEKIQHLEQQLQSYQLRLDTELEKHDFPSNLKQDSFNALTDVNSKLSGSKDSVDPACIQLLEEFVRLELQAQERTGNLIQDLRILRRNLTQQRNNQTQVISTMESSLQTVMGYNQQLTIQVQHSAAACKVLSEEKRSLEARIKELTEEKDRSMSSSVNNYVHKQLERIREEHRSQLEELQNSANENRHEADEYMKLHDQLFRKHRAVLEELAVKSTLLQQYETQLTSFHTPPRDISPIMDERHRTPITTISHQGNAHALNNSIFENSRTHQLNLPNLAINRSISSPPILAIKTSPQKHVSYESMGNVDFTDDDIEWNHNFRIHENIDELLLCESCKHGIYEAFNKDASLHSVNNSSRQTKEDVPHRSTKKSFSDRKLSENYPANWSDESISTLLPPQSRLRTWLGSIFTVMVASVLGINRANVTAS